MKTILELLQNKQSMKKTVLNNVTVELNKILEGDSVTGYQVTKKLEDKVIQSHTSRSYEEADGVFELLTN